MRNQSAPPGSNMSVLLIDDNRLGLLARRAVLEEQGFETTIASDPAEGLSLFGLRHFDIVITDYKMPRMSGSQVIERIRSERPGVPVILLSGMVDALGLDERNTGADAVIPKSSTEVTHLIRAVMRLLRRTPPKKPVRSQTARTVYKVQSV